MRGLRKRHGRSSTSSATYGRVDPPRRVQIVTGSGAGYFKPGQFAFVIGYDTRGGMYAVDDSGPPSAVGEKLYMVAKSKHARGGALWFHPRSLRFTRGDEP